MASPDTIVNRWIAAVNAHDPGALEATLDAEFVWELGGSSTRGSGASREAWALWFAAFPDFAFEVLQTISGGPFVVTRVRMTGTHLGELRFRGVDSMQRGIPATGKHFDIPGCAVHEVHEAKVRRLWAYWDTGGLMRQLGIPPPG